MRVWAEVPDHIPWFCHGRPAKPSNGSSVAAVMQSRVHHTPTSCLLPGERLSPLEVTRQAGMPFHRLAPTAARRRRCRRSPDARRDATSQRARVPADASQAVLERMFTGGPPGAPAHTTQTTHWTRHAIAAVSGLSLKTGRRIWHARRVDASKRSTDPARSPSSTTWRPCTWSHLAARSRCRSPGRARSKRSAARSQGCRSGPTDARPPLTAMSAAAPRRCLPP